jgi:phosphate uptake regulator
MKRTISMQYRTLIGDRGSFRVNVPKDWVKVNGLKKGDYVKIDEASDGSLRIEKAEK